MTNAGEAATAIPTLLRARPLNAGASAMAGATAARFVDGGVRKGK
jgi:hypothetical protein